MFTITILRTIPPHLQKKSARLFVTNIGRARAMLSERCSEKLTPTAITPTTINPNVCFENLISA